MKVDVVFVFLKLTSVFPVYICALISFFFFFEKCIDKYVSVVPAYTL